MESKVNFNLGVHELTVFYTNIEDIEIGAGSCFVCGRVGDVLHVRITEISDRGIKVGMRTNIAKAAIEYIKPLLGDNVAVCNDPYHMGEFSDKYEPSTLPDKSYEK